MSSDNTQDIERTIKIRRCAAVVKGGRRFSFAAMVVVGNGRGKVGWGYGKANEVPPSVEKATKQAAREQIEVPIIDDTIPHVVRGRCGAAEVILVPADAGTGVIAGAAVRAVCDTVEEDLPLDFNRYRDASGRLDRLYVARAALLRPGLIVPLWRLRRRVALCSENLAVSIHRVLERGMA